MVIVFRLVENIEKTHRHFHSQSKDYLVWKAIGLT